MAFGSIGLLTQEARQSLCTSLSKILSLLSPEALKEAQESGADLRQQARAKGLKKNNPHITAYHNHERNEYHEQQRSRQKPD